MDGVLAFTHVVVLPGFLLLLVLYFTRSDLLVGFMEMPLWKLIGIKTA